MNAPASSIQLDPAVVVSGTPQEIRPGRSLNVSVHEGTQFPETVFFLVHGGGGNQNQWRHQWQALIDAGYSVVAWDFLGHGSSPKPKDPLHYRGSEFLEDYLSIFSRYQRQRNVLVGHSYGGATTLRLLQRLQHDGRLHEVAAAAVLGTPYPAEGRPAKVFPLVRLPVFLLNFFKPLLAARFRKLAWAPEADPALIAYEEKIAAGNPIYVFRALLSQAEWFDTSRLTTLNLPLLVLAGDSDGLAPPDRAQLLAQQLPAAQLHVFAQCGHQIQLEKPQDVNRLLLTLASADVIEKR